MGRVRVCGKVCHKAKCDKCTCWCGGLFHGAKGNLAREAFKEEFGSEPKGERGGERWSKAMEAARRAGTLFEQGQAIAAAQNAQVPS